VSVIEGEAQRLAKISEDRFTERHKKADRHAYLFKNPFLTSWPG